MKRHCNRTALAVVATALVVLSTGCNGARDTEPEIVAVYAGGDVKAREVGDPPPSSQDLEDRIRDIAWHEIFVAKWRADLDTSGELGVLVAELERQAPVERVLAEVAAQAEISDEQFENYLDELRAKNEAPKVRIRHIYLRVDSDDSHEVRSERLALAQKLRDDAVAGTSFEDLAREYSDSGDASTGGLVNTLRPGMADREFEEVAFALSEGETSDIIETPSGFHIIRLEHRYPPQPFNEQQYRQNARPALRRVEVERLQKQLAASLKRTESFEIGWTEEGPAPFGGPDEVLLEIGDFRFTADDLERARRQQEPALQRWDQRAEYLESLLERELLYHESLRRFEPTPSEIEHRRTQATDEAALELSLEREGREVKKAITLADLESFVAGHEKNLTRPVEFHTRVIFVSDGSSPYHALKVTEEITALLQSGESFSAVAQQASDGPNADRGGDLGYLDRIGLFKYAPELSRAAESLEIDRFSEAMRISSARLTTTVHALKAGFLIVELVDRLPEHRLDLSHDEEAIRTLMWDQYESQLMEERRDQVLTEMGYRRLR